MFRHRDKAVVKKVRVISIFKAEAQFNISFSFKRPQQGVSQGPSVNIYGIRASGIFFWGQLLRFAAVCGEPYDRGGRIWSLAIRTNRAFRSKFTAFASKLRQTACFVINLQQTVHFVISPQQTVYFVYFAINRTFCNKFVAK